MSQLCCWVLNEKDVNELTRSLTEPNDPAFFHARLEFLFQRFINSRYKVSAVRLWQPGYS